MRQEPSTQGSSARDRRRVRRLDGLGQVQARLLFTSMPTAVRDLSAAGIALETAQAIAVGSPHRLLLRGVTGTPSVEVSAKAVHCMRLAGPTGLAIYLVGFAFGQLDHASREALDAILDEVDALSSAADLAVSQVPAASATLSIVGGTDRKNEH